MIMNGAYVNGLDQTDGLNGTLALIPGSLTTDYMLTSLNVSNTGADINYGWNLGCKLASGGKVTAWTRDYLCKVVSAGVSQGKCQRVWLVIGGAVDYDHHPKETSAFTNIQDILTAGGKLKDELLANFGALHQVLSQINGVESVGFDMDYEESGQLSSVVANVTLALLGKCNCLFTFCPSFDLQNDWITALQQINKSTGIQPVLGYNLQCYAGGGGNDPRTWTANIAKAKGTGVPNPANFVWPIVSCDPDASPVIPSGQVAQTLQGWQSKGGSLWATRPTSGPRPDLKAYSAAIAQGIA